VKDGRERWRLQFVLRSTGWKRPAPKIETGMPESQKIGRGNQTSIPLLLEENWMFLN
jgi:hypothetical protein